MNKEKLELGKILENVPDGKAGSVRMKNSSDKLIEQREFFDINKIEFKIIKSQHSSRASAEVGVAARDTEFNITIKSTSLRSQHQNKLAAIELMKKEISKILG